MRAILDPRNMLGRQPGPLTQLLLRQPQRLASAAQGLFESRRIAEDVGMHVRTDLVMISLKIRNNPRSSLWQENPKTSPSLDGLPPNGRCPWFCWIKVLEKALHDQQSPAEPPARSPRIGQTEE
jgi:hypothetical protein